MLQISIIQLSLDKLLLLPYIYKGRESSRAIQAQVSAICIELSFKMLQLSAFLHLDVGSVEFRLTGLINLGGFGLN